MLKNVPIAVCCVIVWSCAKPSAPESLTPGTGGYSIVATVPTPGSAQDVEVQDTVAFVAQGEGGLAIVDIADRTKARLLSICIEGVRGYSYKLARKDSIVYIAAGGFGINSINVARPQSPLFVAHYGGASSTNDIEIFGTWLLEAKGEAGLRFDDLAGLEPGYVDARGTILSPGYARGMTVTSDSTLLLTCGEMGLAIYDLRDIEHVQGFYDARKKYEAWIDLPGYAVDVAVLENRKIAYVACGTRGVYVVDFSDTANVKVIGSYATRGYAKEIAYQNRRVYVTTELRGLQILSVENPAAPSLVGVVSTSYALGVAVDSRYVYVADQNDGLIIISIPQY